MFLGCYEFQGDPAELLVAYDRLMERFGPEASDLHVCVVHGSGITVFDTCPSREVFEAFSASAEFRGAVAAAALPYPIVRPLGDVHVARCRSTP